MPQKRRLKNPSARKTIKQIASINTKKIAGPEGTGAEDYANLDSVDIRQAWRNCKKAYLVSQYVEANMDIPVEEESSGS